MHIITVTAIILFIMGLKVHSLPPPTSPGTLDVDSDDTEHTPETSSLAKRGRATPQRRLLWEKSNRDFPLLNGHVTHFYGAFPDNVGSFIGRFLNDERNTLFMATSDSGFYILQIPLKVQTDIYGKDGEIKPQSAQYLAWDELVEKVKETQKFQDIIKVPFSGGCDESGWGYFLNQPYMVHPVEEINVWTQKTNVERKEGNHYHSPVVQAVADVFKENSGITPEIKTFRPGKAFEGQLQQGVVYKRSIKDKGGNVPIETDLWFGSANVVHRP